MPTRTCRVLAATCTAVLAAAAVAPAQAPLEIFGWAPGTALEVPEDSGVAPQAGCRFGVSMAMTDRVAVIGAPDTRLTVTIEEEVSTFNGAGAAFVFVRDPVSGEWTFAQRLVGPVLALLQTGASVAIDPATSDIVVGAWAYSVRQAFAGAAFVYRKGEGDTWGESAEELGFGDETRAPSQVLAPATLAAIDQFGFSVAMHDGSVAVGAPLFGTSNTGAVFTFARGEDGVYRQTQRIQDETSGSNDQFGTKVALHRNLLVVGVQNDDVQGRVNAGSVSVYNRPAPEESWALSTRINAPSPVTGGAFGAAVACFDGEADWVGSGSPTAASGPDEGAVSGNGFVTVHRSVDAGANWTLSGTLLPRRANLNNNFGYSVAMSQTEPPQVMAGSPGYDTAIPNELSEGEELSFRQIVNAGAAFAFTFNGEAWSIRGAGPVTGDLWAPQVVIANTSLGRSVAVAPTLPTLALAGAETPTGSTGNAIPFTFERSEVGVGPGDVAGPAPGPLDENGRPVDPINPPPGGGGGGTGGGIGGGGAPGTGITTGPGAIETPLTPIRYEWGLIKASAVSLRGRDVYLLQSDGKHSNVRPEFQFLSRLPQGAVYAGIGDFNGDQSGDVLFTEPSSTDPDVQVLKYWKRDGFRVVETRTIDALPDGFDVAVVADIGNDRTLDIVLQDAEDPTRVTVWSLQGSAISASTDYQLPEGDWQLSDGAFRTRTGRDLILRDRATGEVRVLAGSGDTVTFPVIGQRPMNMRLAGFGDANGDGQPDLFWQGKRSEIDTVGQDEDGNYVTTSSRRAGFANKPIIDIRDWNDDGTVDFWCQTGRRNFIMYGLFQDGYMYSAESKDLGGAPGSVMGFAAR